jgi:DNA polymerase-3 subunit alpha
MKALNKDFVHTHCHLDRDSNLRFKDSIVKVPQLIEQAYEMGNKGVAFTGHESLSSHIKAMQYLEEERKKGRLLDFKNIYGNEIYLVDEKEWNYCTSNNERMDFFHFIVLATDEIGHNYLRQLSTRAWRRAKVFKAIKRTPTFYTDIEEVVKEQGHLIFSTACLGSFLGKTTLETFNEETLNLEGGIDEEAQIDFINWCKDIVGKDNFYLEMQPAITEEQIIYNKHLVKLSKVTNTPMIIATDVHYLRPEHRKIHEAFITSDDNSGSRETGKFYEATYMYYVDEIYERMGYIGEDILTQAIKNTSKILDKCEYYTIEKQTTIPLIPLPPYIEWYQIPEKLMDKLREMSDIFPNIRKMYNSENDYDAYWISLIFKGLETRGVWQGEFNLRVLEHLKRIDLECFECMGVSEKINQPMSSYFIVMNKICVDLIWGESESLVGVSRGSALGWVTNYLCYLVDVNPLDLPMDCPHWRFLCADRPDYPDIDIDVPSTKKDYIFFKIREYFRSIGGDCVRVGTFRTESAKSCVKSVARGMEINADVSAYLSSLIPVERGAVWSIKDTYYGNSKEGRLPVQQFIDIVDQYEGLLDALILCEDLVSGLGIHASGAVPINKPIHECNNSIQQASNGEYITCFDLHESEWSSALKFDLLTTEAQSILQTALELLIEHKKIEWQGGIRKTYEKYLMPNILDYSNKQMWEDAINGKILNLFQFETPQGAKTIKQIKPHSLLELANANSLMRLMRPNGEQPSDQYTRYKNDISEWYEDMEKYGLNEKEMSILREHLDKSYGITAEQEILMLLTMDERISCFNIVESNLIRKGIAKKNPKAREDSKKLFYKKGLENGCRELFLDYIWNELFSAQFGYSFSILHTLGYSTIAIQEMNLYKKYPSIYWACACLLVKSNSIDRDYVEGMDIENKERQNDSATISKALGELQNANITIAPPNINRAQVGFVPNEEDNSILMALKNISGINNATAKRIIENRPYSSLIDFHKRMVETKEEVVLSTGKLQNKSIVSESATISLIKAGAFDEVEGKPREQIMDEYLHVLQPNKTKTTAADIDRLQDVGLIPAEYDDYLSIHNFVQAIKDCPIVQEEELNTKGKKVKVKYALVVDNDIEYQEKMIRYLEEHFISTMTEGVDYKYSYEGNLMVRLDSRKNSLQGQYKTKIVPLIEYLKSEECLNNYNDYLFKQFKENRASGSISIWEFESCAYYSKENGGIFDNIRLEDYLTTGFDKLPEQPIIDRYFIKNGNKLPIYKIDRIAVTVVDKNINKNYITCLDSSGAVINVKLGQRMSFYNRTISVGNGKDKVVIDKGYFEKGTLLLINGYRKGEDFIAKSYVNSILGKHTVMKVKKIINNELIIQSERPEME